MATPTPAEMVAAITVALAKAPGVKVIMYSDGRRVEWDRKQAIQELGYWQAQVDAQASSGLTMSRMNLLGDA